MILRVRETQWTPFIDGLRSRRDVETAGIILAERLHGGEVLFAKEFIAIAEEGYLIRKADQIRVDPVAINRIARRARESGLSIVTVHTHPRTLRPWFSRADDVGDSRLMPSLFAQMEGPHGSMVIAGDSGEPICRLWDETGALHEVSVRIIGTGIHSHQSDASGVNERQWFNRQVLALGKDGQAVLRGLHVGVVGLGGTGSVAFTQLAHLGVGRITVVDADRVEESNISRILGARREDAGITLKVDVARRYADQLGMGTIVTRLDAHLGKNARAADIEACDVILSCVDRHTPRALLNRLSYDRAIPVIDMGSAFRVDTTGRVVAGVGRVVVIGPDRPCLACWGHIDPHRLRIEALSSEDRASQAAEGYVEGADISQPSVIAFNTSVAGAAIVELLRLATGFAGTVDPPMRLSFDFELGTVRRNSLAARQNCAICSPGTGATDDHTLTEEADATFPYETVAQ